MEQTYEEALALMNRSLPLNGQVLIFQDGKEHQLTEIDIRPCNAEDEKNYLECCQFHNNEDCIQAFINQPVEVRYLSIEGLRVYKMSISHLIAFNPQYDALIVADGGNA